MQVPRICTHFMVHFVKFQFDRTFDLFQFRRPVKTLVDFRTTSFHSWPPFFLTWTFPFCFKIYFNKLLPPIILNTLQLQFQLYFCIVVFKRYGCSAVELIHSIGYQNKLLFDIPPTHISQSVLCKQKVYDVSMKFETLPVIILPKSLQLSWRMTIIEQIST